MLSHRFARTLIGLCLAGLAVTHSASAQAKPSASGQAKPSASAQAKPSASAQAKPSTSPRQPAPVITDGAWTATLKDGAQVLRLRLSIKRNEKHEATYTLFSLDQGNQPIPCGNVKQEGTSLSFDVPAVKGHWAGVVSPDAKTLTGTWTQDSRLPLVFTREGP